jgi:hypothetical protein
MLNVTHTFTMMEIPMTVTGAVQAARKIVSGRDIGDDATASDTAICKNAAKFIRSLLSLEVEFADASVARVTAMAAAEAIAKVEGEIADEAVLFAQAVERAEKHMKAPANLWMYAKTETELGIVETREIADAGISVVVRADGRIKRGGKQEVALALFNKYVVNSETPCDNACFVQILMKEAGMSLAGARTYAHNLRKANGMVK